MNVPIVPLEIEAPQNEYQRLIEALIRGEIADAVFAMRCQEYGVTPAMRPPGASPLEFIATASACIRGQRQ